MESRPYPFVKNRYFTGKLLSAADFEREQAYYDGKNAFLSLWTFGPGIAAGLSASRIDGESLAVEPGFAVDGAGRMVIVDAVAIRRVQALDGFAQLEGQLALLTLHAKSEWQEPVFCAFGEGEGQQEHGAVREGFCLRLSGPGAQPICAADRALFTGCVLYEDEELRVRQVLPRVLAAQGETRFRLILERFCAEPVEISLRYAPVVPGFVQAQSGDAPVLDIKVMRLEEYQTELTLTLIRSGDTAAQAAVVSLERDSFALVKRQKMYSARAPFQEELPVVSGDPMRALQARLREMPLDALWQGEDGQGVPLALLRFVRYGEGCLLDAVIPVAQAVHAYNPFMESRLRQCAAFFSGGSGRAQPDQPKEPAPKPLAVEIQRKPVRQMQTGVMQIAAGLHTKAGETLYSEECAHGLGPGPVCVEFGVENVYPAADLGRNRTEMLLGDVSLFAQAGGTFDTPFDKGARVHPDKGTFELAVRLHAPLCQPVLRLRWFAWRAAEETATRLPAGTLSRLVPDICTVAPGAVVNFLPVFTDGADAPCVFTVEGRHGGAVTKDGIYTAPGEEGLFQVRAQVHGRPDQQASAFVIVKRAGKQDGSGGV